MAVATHDGQSLEKMELQLMGLAKRVASLRKTMKDEGILSIRVDNEKDREKGIQRIDDWLVEADVAVSTAKIRANASKRKGA